MNKLNIEEVKTFLFEMGMTLQNRRLLMERGITSDQLRDMADRLYNDFKKLTHKWAEKYNFEIYFEEKRRYIEPNGNDFSFTAPLFAYVPMKNGNENYSGRCHAHVCISYQIDAVKGHPKILRDGIEVMLGYNFNNPPDESENKDDPRTSPDVPELLNTPFDKDFLKKIGMTDDQEKMPNE